MTFATETERQEASEAINLPRNSSINALQTDGVILETTLGRYFRNSISTVKFIPGFGVSVSSKGEYEDFMSMVKKRGETDSNLSFWKSGKDLGAIATNELELSNVGISIAVNTQIDGKNYAILARRRMREGNQRLMLISGYIDASKFFKNTGEVADVSGGAHVILNALKEGSEEALLGRQPGWFRQAEFKGDLIRNVANELAVVSGNHIERTEEAYRLKGDYADLDYSYNWWKMTTKTVPAYISNIFTPPTIEVDGTTFNGAGFQVHMHTNSGQIILGLEHEMNLDTDRELLSLLHAEDGPLGTSDALKAGLKADSLPPDLLATRLDKYGLILCELDADGELTPNFFNFIEGSLVKADHLGDLGNIYLSDAFVPSASKILNGFVDTENIRATEYFS